MNRSIRNAALIAAGALLCACAPQPNMVRPTPAQLQGMLPLPVTDVIKQDTMAAQDTFTSPNVYMLPNPAVPIVVGAAGGALGMAIVDAAIKADARRFAELHVQPVREVLQGFDARVAISQSLQVALAQQPSLFGSYEMKSGLVTTPAAAGNRAIIETSYTMTPDFSALQVIATVSLYEAGSKDGKAVYRNVLVYQSPRMTVQGKTEADVDRLVAQENSHFAALHIDDEIRKANAALTQGDSQANRMRQKITDEQLKHVQKLKQAKAPAWDPDTLADQLCLAWSTNHGEALKVAMSASGAEIAHMIQLDIAGQSTADPASLPRTVFQNDVRKIEYRKGGGMVSLALADQDASMHAVSSQVFIPPPVAPSRR